MPARLRPTYSGVVATLALAVAVGGTSYAAVQLPKNSVGAKQLKPDSVSGPKVKNGSLTAADLDAASRAKLTGARAYGVVRSDGTLVVARSKNVTASRVEAGDYCVTPKPGSGIVAAKTTIFGTADFSDGTGSDHMLQLYKATEPGSSGDCPGGFELFTSNYNEGTQSFDRLDIAFSFVIP